MENLVAVEVTTVAGEKCYFLTWGRIQAPVDRKPLEALILSLAHHWALPSAAASARVCESLAEAREAPYFYEALFAFSQKPIPFDDGYDSWRRATDERMRNFEEIYFVGPYRRGDDWD
jgi:hypothetical protein